MGARLAGAGMSRYTIAQNAQMNVTPFVDVMMVLLIIFMVAVPLSTKVINLDLPPAPPSAPAVPEEPIYISVQESGLYIGDQATTPETLVADLKARIGDRKPADARVYVRAEPDVPYEAFMAVMSTLKSNKFSQIGLINEDIH